MDFNSILVNGLAQLLIVLRRFLWLVISPYKTLRQISREKDYGQTAVIFIFVGIYFFLANFIRKFPIHPLLVFIIFIIHFSITVLFFYSLSYLFNKKSTLQSYIFTFSYGLFPTLIWFGVNSILFKLLPPPRTYSYYGQFFTLVFFTFSISLFLWKLTLFYLAVRFSSKLNFYRIVFMIILYLCLLIPYSYIMYQLHIFRIPFI